MDAAHLHNQNFSSTRCKNLNVIFSCEVTSSAFQGFFFFCIPVPDEPPCCLEMNAWVGKSVMNSEVVELFVCRNQH